MEGVEIVRQGNEMRAPLEGRGQRAEGRTCFAPHRGEDPESDRGPGPQVHQSTRYGEETW